MSIGSARPQGFYSAAKRRRTTTSRTSICSVGTATACGRSSSADVRTGCFCSRAKPDFRHSTSTLLRGRSERPRLTNELAARTSLLSDNTDHAEGLAARDCSVRPEPAPRPPHPWCESRHLDREPGDARTMKAVVRVGADQRPLHGERDALLGCSADLLLAECGARIGAGRSCTRIGNAEAARSCRRRQSGGHECPSASFAEVRRDHDIGIEGAHDNTHRVSLSAWRLFLIRCSSPRLPRPTAAPSPHGR